MSYENENRLLSKNILWHYSCNGIDKNGNVLGTKKVIPPDRHSPFEMRTDLYFPVFPDYDGPTIMDLPSFTRKIDWDDFKRKTK